MWTRRAPSQRPFRAANARPGDVRVASFRRPPALGRTPFVVFVSAGRGSGRASCWSANVPPMPRRYRLFTFLLMISLDSASKRPLQLRNTPVETCGTACDRRGGFPVSAVRLSRRGGPLRRTGSPRACIAAMRRGARRSGRGTSRAGASSRRAGRIFDNLVKRRRRPAPSPVQNTDGRAWR